MHAAIAFWLGAQAADIVYTTYCITAGTCYELNPLQHILGWGWFGLLKLAAIVGLPYILLAVYKKSKPIGLLTAWTAAIVAALPTVFVGWQLFR